MGLIFNDYQIVIGGNDVTSRFRPRLLDLTVSRNAGKAADSASITVANPNGEVGVPADRAPVTIHLGGTWVFEGYVTETDCNIDKGAGRTIGITASSVDQGGKAKEPVLRHKDEASFADAAKEFGSKAGLSVQVAGSIASTQRDYWLQQNESFISWGQRVSREIGATFKVIGSRAFFTARNEGLAISGRPLTTIAATWGTNLMSASIRPNVSRPRFQKVKISYFDAAKGEKVEEEIDTGIGDVEATLRHVLSMATKDQANKRADALGKESDREKGQGDVTILGDARAEPEALCIVSGVMPGADGAYRIDSVNHKVSKSAGFTTSLTLRQPQDGAGSDSRF